MSTTYKFLREAVCLINRIEDGKLSLLATRIAQSFVNCTEDKPFTDEELQKLEGSLEMGRDEIELSVRGLFEMFSESVYERTSPNALESRLSTMGLDQAKVTALVAVWTKAMSAVSDAFKRKSVLPQVGHIAYSISVEAGCDSSTAEKTVKGHLQLGMKSSNKTENLDLEFDHEELYKLHSQLTRIQSQLDAIADN